MENLAWEATHKPMLDGYVLGIVGCLPNSAIRYNGMVLQEYYFHNMMKQGSGNPERNAAFVRTAVSSFGSDDTWKADFASVGKMRGVGWRSAIRTQ
jgi:hypothetical protein